MKKQKSMGNKGFSLVELIIVIAIMAILVGVMAPQLLKYVEKTRVSADTQVADTVRTAFLTAMMDPTVMEEAASVAVIAGWPVAGQSISSIATDSSAFGKAVAVSLGEAAAADITADWIKGKLKSKGASDISVKIVGSNNVEVTITGSKKNGDGTGDAIVVK